jgi:hypothetical protein
MDILRTAAANKCRSETLANVDGGSFPYKSMLKAKANAPMLHQLPHKPII